MDYVEPIRDKRKIAQIKNTLKSAGRYRDLLLFVVGINAALRVSDLLKLQIGNFVDADGFRSQFRIREQKRGKRNEVVINDAIREALRDYLAAYPAITQNLDNYLFFNTRRADYTKPITRAQAWSIISSICKEAGLNGTYGTHTLRKTWGYQARIAGVPLELIMQQLNHSNMAVTKRYLSITDDELGEVVRNNSPRRFSSGKFIWHTP